ncbi:transketolase C-terminal domain-containing protein, partial [Streptomyces scabiei]
GPPPPPPPPGRAGPGWGGPAAAPTAEGWDLEVADLRSLVPFDDETVAASVRRTGRAVVVHESGSYGGPGGEIAARVT